jgi:hypothetical protein
MEVAELGPPSFLLLLPYKMKSVGGGGVTMTCTSVAEHGGDQKKISTGEPTHQKRLFDI